MAASDCCEQGQGQHVARLVVSCITDRKAVITYLEGVLLGAWEAAVGGVEGVGGVGWPSDGLL